MCRHLLGLVVEEAEEPGREELAAAQRRVEGGDHLVRGRVGVRVRLTLSLALTLAACCRYHAPTTATMLTPVEMRVGTQCLSSGPISWQRGGANHLSMRILSISAMPG